MASTNINQINRLMKEIADLQKSDARESRKESDLTQKINRATKTAINTKNNSTVQSKLSEIERAKKDLATVHKKRASIASKIADKSKKLYKYQENQKRDEDRARKKVADEQKRLIREQNAYQQRIKTEILDQRNRMYSTIDSPEMSYDFFVSHASEDKEEFVRELVQALEARGAKVWYDEFMLKVGDSLRRRIDQGLRNSRFGIVVLSEHFFKKEWPNKELDGLFQLEDKGEKRILPIWHKISKDEIIKYSPLIADKFALNSSLSSIEGIAEQLCDLLK